MDDLFTYERINASTWAYMSSLLMVALFFKFNRFWSVRNFDLLLIILLAPGLLMVVNGRSSNTADRGSAANQVGPNQIAAFETGQNDFAINQPAADSPMADNGSITANARFELSAGQRLQRLGYYWLFAVGTLFLIRLLADPSFTRKPVLDPNLTSGGLIFLGASLMMFLYVNIIVSEPTPDDLKGARDSLKLLQRKAVDESDTELLKRQGPGYWLFNLIPIISTSTIDDADTVLETDASDIARLKRYVVAAKLLAIASQVLIVLGLVLFCHYHFGNFNVGVGTATIYLMLPYTAVFTGHALHSLPAALLVWALVCFRRPSVSGVLMGMAIGVSYYPIFLLPLWLSFYWERGVKSFSVGVLISLMVCILGLVFTSPDVPFFLDRLRGMFGFLLPRLEGLAGIWELGWSGWYRMPLLVACVALSVSFVSWPPEKNLGTLAAYTAAIMVAVQFWMGFDGGLCMAWYLPIALLVFFRPNLNGRVALVELNESHRRSRAKADENLSPV